MLGSIEADVNLANQDAGQLCGMEWAMLGLQASWVRFFMGVNMFTDR